MTVADGFQTQGSSPSGQIDSSFGPLRSHETSALALTCSLLFLPASPLLSLWQPNRHDTIFDQTEKICTGKENYAKLEETIAVAWNAVRFPVLQSKLATVLRRRECWTSRWFFRLTPLLKPIT